jgi:CRP/FNR family cyclic AMP-dependent transcriptional regulator
MCPSMNHKNKTAVVGNLPFSSSAVVRRSLIVVGRSGTIFTQGDLSRNVLYIQQGGVRFSVINKTGKEAVIRILGSGDFFGEGA